jgi:hypothetical protein
MERIRRALLSLDVEARPHEPPRLLAQRVGERLGAAGQTLAAMLHALDAQRYGRAAATRPDTGLTRRFAAAARQLRRNRSAPSVL